jgi:hypothetical protein
VLVRVLVGGAWWVGRGRGVSVGLSGVRLSFFLVVTMVFFFFDTC